MTQQKNNAKFGNAVFGAVMVGIGVLFLIANFFPRLDMDILWPFFMLIPATILTALFLRDREKYVGALFPITLLIFYAVYFLWLNFTSWENTITTWPNFIIGPGVSFLVLYLAKREVGFLIPAFILILLGAIFYSEILDSTMALSLALIAGGVALVARSFFVNGKKEELDSPSEN